MFWTVSLCRFSMSNYTLVSFSRETGYRRAMAVLSPPTHPPAGFSCFKDSRSSCITLSQTNEETGKPRAVWKATAWTTQDEKGKVTDRNRIVSCSDSKGKKINTERCNILKGKKKKKSSSGGAGGWWHGGVISGRSTFQPFSSQLMPACAAKNTLSALSKCKYARAHRSLHPGYLWCACQNSDSNNNKLCLQSLFTRGYVYPK